MPPGPGPQGWANMKKPMVERGRGKKQRHRATGRGDGTAQQLGEKARFLGPGVPRSSQGGWAKGKKMPHSRLPRAAPFLSPSAETPAASVPLMDHLPPGRDAGPGSFPALCGLRLTFKLPNVRNAPTFSLMPSKKYIILGNPCHFYIYASGVSSESHILPF